MSHAQEALVALAAAITNLPRRAKLPELGQVALIVERLGATKLASAPPPEDSLRSLARRLNAAFSGKKRDQVSSRDLRNAPWVLWHQDHRCAQLPGLINAVVSHAGGSVRTTLNLIEAWLRHFDASEKTIAAAGAAIRSLLAKAWDAKLEPWRKADSRLSLFDAKGGPRTVAGELLSCKKPVGQVLGECGMHEPLRASGDYMRAVTRELLGQLPKSLRSNAAPRELQRALEYLAPGELRHGATMKAEIANALLAAWLDGGRAPSGAIQTEVREFLLKHLGDPRTRQGEWAKVSSKAVALIRSWLARASLKAFFNLIADHAYDKQWRYREAFWSAYLDHIEDAWLVLGSDAYHSARSIRDLSGGYGRLDGAARDQSVLLFRMGSGRTRLVICEWSHNGKLRAWPSDWKDAPPLYQEKYSRRELTGKCLPFPPNTMTGFRGNADGSGLVHSGAPSGSWQGSAAELIARRIGVRLGPESWMP